VRNVSIYIKVYLAVKTGWVGGVAGVGLWGGQAMEEINGKIVGSPLDRQYKQHCAASTKDREDCRNCLRRKFQ